MSIDMQRSLDGVKYKFQQYRDLIAGIAEGRLRHLIIRGTPGVGKSYEAEDVLIEYDARRTITYRRSAGHTTALSLYNNLYECRKAKDVTLYDDCDAVFKESNALNILKAATDTRTTRRITWNSTSSKVYTRDFIYEGRIIIITNLDLRSSDRYEALLDRCLYFDMTFSPEEKLARIIQLLYEDPTPASEYSDVRDVVSSWLVLHFTELGERLTIRTAFKCIDLARSNHDNWQELAAASIVGR